MFELPSWSLTVLRRGAIATVTCVARMATQLPASEVISCWGLLLQRLGRAHPCQFVVPKRDQCWGRRCVQLIPDPLTDSYLFRRERDISVDVWHSSRMNFWMLLPLPLLAVYSPHAMGVWVVLSAAIVIRRRYW